MHLFEIFEKYFDSFSVQLATRSNRFKVSEHRNYWKRFNQIYQHASFRTRRETLLPTVASIESIIIETKLWSVWWRRGLLEENNQCDIVIMNGKLVSPATYTRSGAAFTAIHSHIQEQNFRRVSCVTCFYFYF